MPCAVLELGPPVGRWQSRSTRRRPPRRPRCGRHRELHVEVKARFERGDRGAVRLAGCASTAATASSGTRGVQEPGLGVTLHAVSRSRSPGLVLQGRPQPPPAPALTRRTDRSETPARSGSDITAGLHRRTGRLRDPRVVDLQTRPSSPPRRPPSRGRLHRRGLVHRGACWPAVAPVRPRTATATTAGDRHPAGNRQRTASARRHRRREFLALAHIATRFGSAIYLRRVQAWRDPVRPQLKTEWHPPRSPTPSRCEPSSTTPDTLQQSPSSPPSASHPRR